MLVVCIAFPALLALVVGFALGVQWGSETEKKIWSDIVQDHIDDTHAVMTPEQYVRFVELAKISCAMRIANADERLRESVRRVFGGVS